jgi:hypothetical protein
MKNKSWRTTTLGIVAILFGLYTGWVAWIPYSPGAVLRETFWTKAWWNLVYVEPSHICLIIVGWALIHARDHRCQ